MPERFCSPRRMASFECSDTDRSTDMLLTKPRVTCHESPATSFRDRMLRVEEPCPKHIFLC